MKLHTRILVGFSVGAAFGLLSRAILGGDHASLQWVTDNIAEPTGRIFLRLLLMCVVPLVFSSIAVGMVGLGDVSHMGRVGGKTLLYTLCVSSISVLIGLGTANLLRPGDHLDSTLKQELLQKYQDKASTVVQSSSSSNKPFAQAIVEILPDNPIAAAAKSPPDMLGLMLFAILFGVALALIHKNEETKEQANTLMHVLDAVFAVSSKIVQMALQLAPIGVGALLFTMTARFGADLLVSLAFFVISVLGALAVQQFGVYPLLLKFFSKMSPLHFFRKIRTVMLTAFSTSSSNATLPTALSCATDDLQLPKETASFVLTIGATANQNGTALFEGITVLFLAQVFGVDLTLLQQGAVLGLAVISGVGTAGVPSGSLPFIAVVLGSVGVPPEAIAIVIGVDRLLDMCRTVLNVTGDLVCAVIVSDGEKSV